MITRELLRSLRNDLPMPYTFQQLGDKAPHSKSVGARTVEGRFRFQCPHCCETLAVVNPRNNLAHCFNCRKNINNIDLLIAVGYGFQEAVTRLQAWLVLYNREKASRNTVTHPPDPVEKRAGPADSIAAILQREFENRGPSAD